VQNWKIKLTMPEYGFEIRALQSISKKNMLEEFIFLHCDKFFVNQNKLNLFRKSLITCPLSDHLGLGPPLVPALNNLDYSPCYCVT
jgi:hypothetical protein